ALVAGVLDDAAGATTAGARLGADEFSECGPGDVLQPAGPAAGRTGRGLGAGLCSAAAARGARDGDRERNLALRPGGRLGELDLDLGRHVGAPGAAGPRRDAEEIVTEEGGEEIREAAEVEARRREAAAAQACVAVPVVELARLGLRQHLEIGRASCRGSGESGGGS